MSEEEKQKRVKYVAIGLGAVAIVLLVVLVVLPLLGQGQGPTTPSPSAKVETTTKPGTQPGGATPSPAGAAPAGKPGAPTAATAGGPAAAPGAATPSPAGGAGPTGGAKGVQAGAAGRPQDPVQLLASATTDAETRATIRRMFGEREAGQQIVSRRVKVVAKPKIPFFDPRSGYGWGVALRGSNISWRPPIVVAAPGSRVAPTATALGPSVAATGAGPTLPRMGAGMMGWPPGMAGRLGMMGGPQAVTP